MFYIRNNHTCFRSQDFTLWIVASTMLYLIVLYWSFHLPNNFSNLDLRLKNKEKYIIIEYMWYLNINYFVLRIIIKILCIHSFISYDIFFIWWRALHIFYNACNHYSCITPQKEFVVPDLWAVWMALRLGGGTTKQAAGTRPSWPLLLRILQRTPSLLSNSKQSMPFSNNI